MAGGIEAVVRTVLGTMRQHITDGEWADIKSAMPKDLATTLPYEARMTVKLNERALDFAKNLVKDGNYVIDARDDWSEHQPSTKQENDFIERHRIGEYARWHLGIDDEQDPERKGRYKFPYGDFERVHRCALLAAESRAGQRKYYDIELAVAHLHGMLEALRAS